MIIANKGEHTGENWLYIQKKLQKERENERGRGGSLSLSSAFTVKENTRQQQLWLEGCSTNQHAAGQLCHQPEIEEGFSLSLSALPSLSLSDAGSSAVPCVCVSVLLRDDETSASVSRWEASPCLRMWENWRLNEGSTPSCRPSRLHRPAFPLSLSLHPFSWGISHPFFPSLFFLCGARGSSSPPSILFLWWWLPPPPIPPPPPPPPLSPSPPPPPPLFSLFFKKTFLE